MIITFRESEILDPKLSKAAIVEVIKQLNLVLISLSSLDDYQLIQTPGGLINDLGGSAGASYTANEQSQINNLRVSFNSVLARLRSHKIINT